MLLVVKVLSFRGQAYKDDEVSFSLLFLCASQRQTVSASAVNLLRHKRKKRTLAETLH